MPMDFFEHQDRARQRTGRLVALFLVGIVATLLVINLACFVLYWFFYDPNTVTQTLPSSQLPGLLKNIIQLDSVSVSYQPGGFVHAWKAWWGSNLNWQISIAVVLSVVIGTVFRFLELAGGGRKVAQWAGATPVDLISKDKQVTQFINVCEEMALAAGMPVPELFVMRRENGINAFVAGFDSDEAVLVITQGALDTFTRDQLQGVIGHEYSHILNGDMRLNVRLMALLAGLVMIGQMGQFLMHSGFSSTSSITGRTQSSSRFGIIPFLAGLIFVVAGYAGVLVGRIIKAAVSRQREFLADASAVQFTRNPDGIAGALYSIQQHVDGSQLRHRHAEDMSHFCFGETVALTDKLATHPPITERIRRVNPNFIAKARTKERLEESPEQSVSKSAPQAFETAIAATGFAALVGQVTPDHVQYAQSMYKHIPEKLKTWVHQSEGAKAFVYCQILLGSENNRQPLVDLIKEEDPAVLEQLKLMWPFCKRLDEQLRLPVIELLIPTLKRFSEADRLILMDRFDRLVVLDGRVDFIEWVVISLIKIRLSPGNKSSSQKLSSDLFKYKGAITNLLSVFVHLNPDRAASEKAYQNVCAQLNLTLNTIEPLDLIGFSKMNQALQLLNGISFMWRKVLLQSCADIVQSDGDIAFQEYEALRIVAESLDCPLPPLMMEMNEDIDDRDIPIPFQL